MELTPTRPRGLAIFDIDGTLTETNALDSSCYARAIQETLGIDGISTEWGSYEHSTDTGILAEVVATRLSRTVTGRDIRMVRARFIQMIDRAAAAPGGVEEVAGAGRMIDHLVAVGWRVAVATGGWRPSAQAKLQAAGLRVDAGLLATADDAIARTDIIRWAIRRAVGRAIDLDAGPTTIPCVYVGDGRWDVEAARESGCGFVGIGAGVRAARMREAGASEVLENFQDLTRFAAAITDAAIAECAQ